jgi:hypothetical protein
MFGKCCFSALAAASVLLAIEQPEEPQGSPHASALELVFKKEAGRIRAIDKENWWHDTKERSWVVRKPFPPAVFDSTHMFLVSYRVDGNEVEEWAVNTALGQVSRRIETRPVRPQERVPDQAKNSGTGGG